METSDLTSRGYGAVLWEPDQQTVHDARITRFMRWLADRGHDFGGYADLWRWSVTDPASFWAAVWDYFEVLGHRGPGPVLTGEVMPDVQWFTGSSLNYARNALRTAWTYPDRTAIIFDSERSRAGSLSYAQLAHQVARVARGLRALGVRRGDRVAALLPNVPEAVIGLLAAASIGAIWSSCSPDFGARSVIDRFAQIEPTVLITGDGYWYGGKEFSRAAMVDDVVTVSDAEIVAAMRLLFERVKVIAEPSGACALAALLAGRLQTSGQRIGVVLSGANIDAQRFGELIGSAAVC